MKNKKAWLGIVISAVFLYLAFRHSDWVEIWGYIRQVNYGVILASTPVFLLHLLLRAWRWRYLLLPAGRPAYSSLFGSMMIGFMANNLLPLRLGEFIRAYVLGRRENLDFSLVLATLVVERIFDGLTLLLMCLVGLLLTPLTLGSHSLAWTGPLAVTAVGIYFLAIAVLVLIRLKTDLIIKVLEIFLKRLPTLQKSAERFLRAFDQGLEAIWDIKLFLIITVLTLLTWLFSALFYWLTMMAFPLPDGGNLGFQVGIFGAFFVLGVVALGIMIPSSPAFIGTYQWACITALTTLSVTDSAAESFSIVAHAVQFIPLTFIGIFYLYYQNFRFKDLKSVPERLGTAPGEDGVNPF